jgi:5-methyltetrahydrofolate--homocysteine methyltransferase
MTLTQAVQQRILVLDGAMGTMIQAYKFEEEDYRGDRFADYPRILLRAITTFWFSRNLKAIDAIHLGLSRGRCRYSRDEHVQFANSISMEDYHMSDLVVELNMSPRWKAHAAPYEQYRAERRD